MAALMLIMVFSFSGCGSSVSSGPVEQYQQKVYVIGEIKDPSSSATGQISEVKGLADEVKQVFVTRVAYDGVSADAPIFIAADQVLSLSDTVRKGILDTYRNSFPVLVVPGGEAEINALLGILGLEQNYRLPENFPYAELFAADRDEGGTFTWSMYPPGASQSDNATDTYVDSLDAQLSRAGMFRDWMKQNGSRASQLTAFKSEAMKALVADGATEPSESNLTKLAQVYQHVKIFTDPVNRNLYKLIYNIYSCHSFNSADGKSYDWFYVEQEGELDGSHGYGTGMRIATGDEKAALGVNHSQDQDIVKYMGSYTMSNSMMVQGGDKSDQSVVLESSSPETANTKTTVSSGVSFDIGGDVGFSAKAGKEFGADLSGALKTGVSIKNDRSVDVMDCTVEYKGMSSGYTDDARWLYTFPRVEQYGWYSTWAKLYEPVKLSKGTFKPGNKWIWRFLSDVRENRKKYKNAFTATLDAENMTSVSGYAFLWIPVKGPYHFPKISSFTDSVPLNYPPLIVAPSQNVNFSAAGQVQYMDAHVSSDWSASSNQTWCQAVPATGKGNNTQVSITVSPNTTGKERKATVTFTTNDGKGKDTMTVTQSQY